MELHFHGHTSTRAHAHRHVHWYAFFPSHSATESRRIPSLIWYLMSLSAWHMHTLFCLSFSRARSLSLTLSQAHTHTHSHIRVHTQAHTCKQTHTNSDTCTHTHSLTYTRPHTHTHTQTLAHQGNWASRSMLRVRKAEESRSTGITPSAHDSILERPCPPMPEVWNRPWRQGSISNSSILLALYQTQARIDPREFLPTQCAQEKLEQTRRVCCVSQSQVLEMQVDWKSKPKFYEILWTKVVYCGAPWTGYSCYLRIHST